MQNAIPEFEVTTQSTPPLAWHYHLDCVAANLFVALYQSRLSLEWQVVDDEIILNKKFSISPLATINQSSRNG